MRIWVRMKDNPSILKLIKEEDYIEESMIREKETKSKLDSILKSGRAPGINTTPNAEPSLQYKGKYDEGAVADYLDTTLDSAKKRAIERENTTGNAFKKTKVPIRRKK